MNFQRLQNKLNPKFVRDAIAARVGGEVTTKKRKPLFHRPVVSNSEELQRILRLPYRVVDTNKPPPVRAFEHLKRHNPNCLCASMGRPCVRDLFSTQEWALLEAFMSNGGLFAYGVGHGKELLSELLPLAMPDVKTAILLIPPDMRAAFKRDWAHYGQHFYQPNLVGGDGPFRPGAPRLAVIAYSELSHATFTAALANYKPDLIIANEAQALCALDSVRTRRLLNYCGDHPECRFVAMSGTLTKKSLMDYGHLAALALGEGSPLPIDPNVLEDWALAIDPKPPWGKVAALPGALMLMCQPGEDIRKAFKRRRAGTPGVLDTSDQGVPNALHIKRRELPPMPQKIKDLMIQVKAKCERPDGEEFQEHAQVAQCLRQLACGFYYRWRFPRGESKALIDEWRAARKAWNHEVRELLQYPKPHLDSPKLAALAAMRHCKGMKGTKEKPTWNSYAWPAWRDIRKKVYHELEAVWEDDWLARDAVEWGKESLGIIWYDSTALGDKIEELSGFKRYGGGAKASEEIELEKGDRTIVCSIMAHGKGKNLQYAFSRGLITEPVPEQIGHEQLLGRTHRKGQKADVVECEYYLHCPEFTGPFEVARERAKYVEETTHNQQRLRRATYLFDVHRI